MSIRYIQIAAPLTTIQVTWTFMSALLLTHPRKPYELANDLESFIHVVTWLAARFHVHNMSDDKGDLEAFVQSRYEKFTIKDDGVYGPEDKLTAMLTGETGLRLNLKYTENLDTLIRSLHRIAKEHYAQVDFEHMARYGVASRVALPSSKDLPDFKLKRKAPVISGSTPPQEGSPEMEAGTTSFLSKSPLTSPVLVGPRSDSARPESKERLLDTHTPIIQVFEAIMKLKGWKELDKHEDQFADLHHSGVSTINTPAVSMQLSQLSRHAGGSGSAQGHQPKRKQTTESGGVKSKLRTDTKGNSVARRTGDSEEGE